MLQNHPSHSTVELPFQKSMPPDPSNNIALEYHEPPNLPLLHLFSVSPQQKSIIPLTPWFEAFSQNKHHPESFRQGKKLGHQLIPIPWPLRPTHQDPRTSWGWRLLCPCQPWRRRRSKHPWLKGFSDLLLLEARIGSSCHSLNSWFVVHW
jgi:hypothetical protein